MKLLIFVCALVQLIACKPPVPSSNDAQSITPKGQTAGKWLATVSIGGGAEASATLFLSETLKKVFLNELGGNYSLAFSLSDKQNWTPNKSDIVKNFDSLRKQIANFKTSHPEAPTMVAFGLTGHGLSQQAFKNSPEGYVFAINQGKSESLIPEEYFSGRELAELIASLGANEVIMFVQSCNSGHLSNVDFMNKYAQVLATETARRNTNIAVITPVSEVVFSPFYAYENVIRGAIEKLFVGAKDVITYADFKDQLVRSACADVSNYYPRSEIKSMSAVQASIELSEVSTLMGIDPQFYESIDPNLPLILTQRGLSKYRNNELKLPPTGRPLKNVPVSSETRNFCANQIAKQKELFNAREQSRLDNLKVEGICRSHPNKESCITNAREQLRIIPTPTSR